MHPNDWSPEWRLIEFRKVVLSQDEPIRSIFKLVEAIKHCSRVFQITAEMTSNANLRQLAEDTHRELEQYVFELQTEIRRLGNEESVPGPVAGDNSGTDTNFLEFRNWCLSPNYHQRALQRVLDCFDEVFKTPLTAHARAMLRRQYEGVTQAREQISRAA
ncbi:MAG: hypothetical protein HY646_10410 [Acidobacteria bacterium]|nr:hypothetical protein [Acidobacteriota bacterium]